MRVYFDNNIVSAISRRDGDSTELSAIDFLITESEASRIILGTSRQSAREMERAPSAYQAKLKTGLSGLDVSTDDYRVLGSYTLTDQYGGFSSNPLVTDIVDESLYAGLLTDGLAIDDAKHLMYAIRQGYQRFLTCDRGILSRRAAIENRCLSIKIQKPSEFVAELSVTDSPKTDPAKCKSLES